jgi:hypothetical protein
MSDRPRDWDKELADIDKVIAKGPAPGSSVPAGPSVRPSAPVRDGGGRIASFATWLRVLLGLLLAVGMTQWPYPNACGFNLAIYLGAILTVIITGLWSSVSSWRSRLGLAHTLSLLVLLWGTILAAREVLPRVGYTRHARTWTCSVTGVEPS